MKKGGVSRFHSWCSMTIWDCAVRKYTQAYAQCKRWFSLYFFRLFHFKIIFIRASQSHTRDNI